MSALPDERQCLIRQRLDRGDRVLAGDLAREFGTSEDTIRRDLRELAAAGLCRRVYGGALPLAPSGGTFGERNVQHQAAKRRLGEAAAALVAPGSVVLIDAGSTNRHVADHLPRDAGLTVVTNAPAIAAAVMERTDCELIVIGGPIRSRIGGAVGGAAVDQLRRIHADILFLGACAANVATGILAFDAEDAAFKQAAVMQSERTIVALTSDKLGTRAPYGVAPLERISDIVIESDADAALAAGFEACGPRLHRARGGQP